MIIEIHISATECRAWYPEISRAVSVGSEDAAINDVKGAVLLCLSDWSDVPDMIQFEVLGRCQHCSTFIDPVPATRRKRAPVHLTGFNCCAACSDARAP